MNKLSIIFSFVCVSIFSQTLEEVQSFHENGQPEEVVFKNIDLQIVKKEFYSNEGKVISSINYDPKTGLKNGDFFVLGSKGYYVNDILNSDNFTFNISGNNLKKEGVFWNGKVKNGRPVGEVTIYKLKEKVEVTKSLNLNMSVELTYELGYGVRYYNYHYKHLNIFDREDLIKINYNEEGQIDGDFNINSSNRLYFENGKLLGYTIKNTNSQVVKDSVFRKNKIWKIENKFRKNNGFVRTFVWNEFNPLIFKNEWGYQFFGSEVSVLDETFEGPDFLKEINFENYGGDYDTDNVLTNIFFMNEDYNPYPNGNGLFYKVDNLTSILSYNNFTGENYFHKFIFFESIKNNESNQFSLGNIIPYKYLGCSTCDIYYLPYIQDISLGKNHLLSPYVSNKPDLFKSDILFPSLKIIKEFTDKTNGVRNVNDVTLLNFLKEVTENQHLNLSEIWFFKDEKFHNYLDYFDLNKINTSYDSKILKEKEKENQSNKLVSISPDWYNFEMSDKNILTLNFTEKNTLKRRIFDVLSNEFSDVVICGVQENLGKVKVYLSERENLTPQNKFNNKKEKILKKLNRKYRNYSTFYGVGKKLTDFEFKEIEFLKDNFNDLQVFSSFLYSSSEKSFFTDMKVNSVKVSYKPRYFSNRKNYGKGVFFEYQVVKNGITQMEFSKLKEYWNRDEIGEKFRYTGNIKDLSGKPIPDSGSFLSFSSKSLANTIIYNYQRKKSIEDIFWKLFGHGDNIEVLVK